MEQKVYKTELAGRELSATFSNLTDQASGSVIMRYGDTTVMVTAVMGKNEREQDWFPLSVDYEEKYYAAGRILGGRFQKREGRPSDEAVLSGRIIDRTIRPLFDHSIRRDVQVVATVLAIDEKNDPDVLAVLGASLALATSNIPWGGPVSALRIGRKLGSAELEINPAYDAPEGRSDDELTAKEKVEKELELLLCGREGKINMIECKALEVGETVIAEAFDKGLAEIENLQSWQESIISEIGKDKVELTKPEVPEGMEELFKSYKDEAKKLMFEDGEKGSIYDLQDKWVNEYKDKWPEHNAGLALGYFEEQVDKMVHDEALDNDKRADGRAMNEIRPLFTQAGGVSNILHGTGVFYRGGTHVLSVLTLGGPKDAQLLEGMEVRGKKSFMHHYNFPPYSTGETGRIGGMNRRAIGHGALAEKALEATLPGKDEFPYTIRLVSEIAASNGSSSMGSVCASTLAMMDGGVPIKRPTAGIAMGLMANEDMSNYKVLTDIQGPEDHYGDMDLKVAGTEEGVTAMQMDVKVGGIDKKILLEAIDDAKAARLSIIDKIKEAIASPREDINPNAPKIVSMKVKEDQIGLVIGGGGKTIKEMSETSGAEIEIEDDGTVYITGKDGAADKAKEMIEELTHEFQPGEIVEEAEVVNIVDFGAFVRLNRETDGLVHVSEIAPTRVSNVSDVLKEGDKVKVIVKAIDERGKLKLSIKDVDPDFLKNKGLDPEAIANAKPKPPTERPNRNNRR